MAPEPLMMLPTDDLQRRRDRIERQVTPHLRVRRHGFAVLVSGHGGGSLALSRVFTQPVTIAADIGNREIERSGYAYAAPTVAGRHSSPPY